MAQSTANRQKLRGAALNAKRARDLKRFEKLVHISDYAVFFNLPLEAREIIHSLRHDAIMEPTIEVEDIQPITQPSWNKYKTLRYGTAAEKEELSKNGIL